MTEYYMVFKTTPENLRMMNTTVSTYHFQSLEQALSRAIIVYKDMPAYIAAGNQVFMQNGDRTKIRWSDIFNSDLRLVLASDSNPNSAFRAELDELEDRGQFPAGFKLGVDQNAYNLFTYMVSAQEGRTLGQTVSEAWRFLDYGLALQNEGGLIQIMDKDKKFVTVPFRLLS